MFSIKINESLIESIVKGFKIDKGDKIRFKYMPDYNKTICDEDLYTVKRIEHYNGDLFSVEFEEKVGSYIFNIQQLIFMKVDE